MASVRDKKNTTVTAKKRRLFKGGFDLPFFVLVMIILMLGLVMMFSASYAYAYYKMGQDSFFFIRKQAEWAVLGIVVMLIVSRIDYHWLHKIAYPVLGASYLFLTVVLFTNPHNDKNIHRWLYIGPINFQPSEIAKFAVILVFAHLISKNYNKMKTVKYGVLPFLAILASIALLMLKEPHVSGTVLILLIGFSLMLIGGTPVKWFVGGFGVAGAAVAGIVIFTNAINYAKVRLKFWLDPYSDPTGNGWQTLQSLYGIGSGGLMGLGLGNSRQKYLYISEPQNDFVFAIVCEELGFIGATIVILLFALLVWRGFVIAMKSPDKFGAILAVGLTIQVGVQALLNIAVVTNTIPNTGISLPFFSYGGSSLVMLLFQMGIILSVSRFSSVEQT
ncbi:MAG TPA: putative lipid II flippase FtsW [Ruminiclostridium sp.]|nr:putative lipid II flippase FtsW [Ruminiclostridium sp.]